MLREAGILRRGIDEFAVGGASAAADACGSMFLVMSMISIWESSSITVQRFRHHISVGLL